VPHPCLSLSFSSQLPTTVLKVVRAIQDEAVLRAALSIYSAVISSEDDFLADKGFARCLTALTGLMSGPSPIKVSARTEAAVVELRFRVAAKIRLHPQILPAWFKRSNAADVHSDGAVEDEPRPGDAHSSATSKGEFPLFYSLMDHVHYESPIGDFARTGLLYILEAASNLPWLERWVVDSDLATLLASGLGALYSQLSGSGAPGSCFFVGRRLTAVPENSPLRFRTMRCLLSLRCQTTRSPLAAPGRSRPRLLISARIC
jgi:hypothetical protein